METNNLQPAPIQELPNAAMHPRPCFASVEDMRKYYLQMADLMNIRHVGEPSELTSIKCLYRKLRQFTDTMRFIGTHDWGKGIAEIHTACGVYMMQSNVEQKKLLQTNEEISQHLQFIAQLAGSVGYIKQLEGVLHYHYQNVAYLLERLKEEVMTANRD